MSFARLAEAAHSEILQRWPKGVKDMFVLRLGLKPASGKPNF